MTASVIYYCLVGTASPSQSHFGGKTGPNIGFLLTNKDIKIGHRGGEYFRKLEQKH
jgi:hypothetical protein